jgi:hypothetical protein
MNADDWIGLLQVVDQLCDGLAVLVGFHGKITFLGE